MKHLIPLAGLFMAAAWSGPTAADPPQTYEIHLTRCDAGMPLPDGTTECDSKPFEVACLGEYVVGEYHVVSNYQEFVTPSGTAQVRDNWKVVSMLFGVTTGRAWYAVGVSPAAATFGKVENWTSTGSLIYRPLADGPKWLEQFVSKFTQNPNGEVVADFHTDNTKCLGIGQ